jgi:kinesin family protein 2/24
VVTLFAYGQTGSGKTFTVNDTTKSAVVDLFKISNKSKSNFNFFMSFYEIYGGKVIDLLNNKKKLQVMEDHNNRI